MIDKDIQFASDLRTTLARLIKKLRKESPTAQHLSLTERSTIGALYQHGALRPSELAAMEMITNQSMSQVLNHLFELRYILRTASETDKRKGNISLSEKGRDMLLRFRNERDEWLAAALKETCTPEEYELLKNAIIPLNKLTEFIGHKQIK